jgi:hypothetical protein
MVSLSLGPDTGLSRDSPPTLKPSITLETEKRQLADPTANLSNNPKLRPWQSRLLAYGLLFLSMVYPPQQLGQMMLISVTSFFLPCYLHSFLQSINIIIEV